MLIFYVLLTIGASHASQQVDTHTFPPIFGVSMAPGWLSADQSKNEGCGTLRAIYQQHCPCSGSQSKHELMALTVSTAHNARLESILNSLITSSPDNAQSAKAIVFDNSSLLESCSDEKCRNLVRDVMKEDRLSFRTRIDDMTPAAARKLEYALQELNTTLQQALQNKQTYEDWSPNIDRVLVGVTELPKEEERLAVRTGVKVMASSAQFLLFGRGAVQWKRLSSTIGGLDADKADEKLKRGGPGWLVADGESAAIGMLGVGIGGAVTAGVATVPGLVIVGAGSAAASGWQALKDWW